MGGAEAVVDASAVVKWFVEEEGSEGALGLTPHSKHFRGLREV